MSKFIISVLVVFLVLSCGVFEPDINSSNAVLDPKPTTPNTTLLNSKSIIWHGQEFTNYSFVQKFSMTSYPADYIAKVTITDGNITGIEILDTVMPDREDYAEDWVKSFGSISSIYEKFIAWNAEALEALEENQKIDFEVKYSEQYNFPEYLRYGVYTYKHIGNNNWVSKIGEGSIIIEISDFTILE